MDLNGAGSSNEELIGSFMEITFSASKEEAAFFLESHQWDLDAAVSTFLDDTNNNNIVQPNPQASSLPRPHGSPSESQSSDYSPSPSRSRSRSLSPADAEPAPPRARYPLRSRGKKPRGEGGSGVRALADLNQAPDGDSEDDDEDYEDEDDEAQQYYAGGEDSGMPVQAPNKQCNGDASFGQARRNSVKRRDEDYSARPTHLKRKTPFPGVGRTLADSSDSDSAVQAASNPVIPVASSSAPRSARGLVVDSSLPTTSIQLRLVDGTRMVSCFNLRHTIRDIRGFIDASRVGGSRVYQLQTMGFPPKQLTNQDQTIEEAGIASSVVIQKL